MKYFIGNTDFGWFDFLRKINPEDINFWQPSGNSNFKAISTGAPFLFKLKRPYNKIAGVGFFSSYSVLPISFAWDVFKERNGVDNFPNFYSKIKSYREASNNLEKNPNIGCIILNNPIFFKEEDWIEPPMDWSKPIVKGKTYDSTESYGNIYWSRIEALLSFYNINIKAEIVSEPHVLYNTYLTNRRIGQGAFRVSVTDAYTRRCAISGERTLPVLEAAHIKSYSLGGQNNTDNGLLLRADLHKLYDTGYLTVTEQYKVEVSKRIKEEFENGRDYYKYHGQSLLILPKESKDMPNKEYIQWHNEEIFLA